MSATDFEGDQTESIESGTDIIFGSWDQHNLLFWDADSDTDFQDTISIQVNLHLSFASSQP